jgi:hypothetical protein
VCQSAFAQLQFSLQIAMHTILDSPIRPQKVELLVLLPDCFQRWMAHRESCESLSGLLLVVLRAKQQKIDYANARQPVVSQRT